MCSDALALAQHSGSAISEKILNVRTPSPPPHAHRLTAPLFHSLTRQRTRIITFLWNILDLRMLASNTAINESARALLNAWLPLAMPRREPPVPGRASLSFLVSTPSFLLPRPAHVRRLTLSLHTARGPRARRLSMI